jgi:hypothetical protein
MKDVLRILFIVIGITSALFRRCACLCALATDSEKHEYFLRLKKLKLSHHTPRWRLGGEDVSYSSYSFSTSKLDWVEWSASSPRRALPSGKGLPVPIVQEDWSAPEPVWRLRLEENPLPLPGIELRLPCVPARGQTLYWLSYLAHTSCVTPVNQDQNLYPDWDWPRVTYSLMRRRGGERRGKKNRRMAVDLNTVHAEYLKAWETS